MFHLRHSTNKQQNKKRKKEEEETERRKTTLVSKANGTMETKHSTGCWFANNQNLQKRNEISKMWSSSRSRGSSSIWHGTGNNQMRQAQVKMQKKWKRREKMWNHNLKRFGDAQTKWKTFLRQWKENERIPLERLKKKHTHTLWREWDFGLNKWILVESAQRNKRI